MIAPPSSTSAWWTSIVCWFRHRTTSGSSPCESSGSSPPRTWVHVCRPLRALILANDSAVEETPSPAAPPTRKARSRFDISTFHLRTFLALRPISSLHYVPFSYTLASTKREVPVRSADPSWNLAPLRGPAEGHNPFGPRGVPAATDHE